ncbi:invasion associated locus B family protein [Oryzibacter oryziterrae]|uniref:invasion associated locus B family protein n=1 Tax=Oryzibacter oryziterrae TaxID=2766474 RepID=UPI001F21A427|nr:invasion associated locus B family protein [Oryzibacter oryziterrae]
MQSKRALSTLLSLSLVLSSFAGISTPAAAQEFSDGKVEQVFGDWQIRCDQPVGARDKQCAMVQNVTAEDRDNIGLSVLIVKTVDKKARIMRVLAPLGVYLMAGLGLRIDDKDIGRAGFVRCRARGCYAEVILQDDLINQLSTGQKALFVIYDSPENGIGIPVSLKGFKEGYAALP